MYEMGIVVDEWTYLLCLYVLLLIWYLCVRVIGIAAGCGGGDTFKSRERVTGNASSGGSCIMKT